MVLLGDDIDDVARSLCNAAHELGQLIMHDSDCVRTSTVEKQAHLFASAFLLPQHGFLGTAPKKLSFSHLGEMKRFWQVSTLAILCRAHLLVKRSDAFLRRILAIAHDAGGRASEAPQRYLEIAQRYYAAYFEDPSGNRLEVVCR